MSESRIINFTMLEKDSEVFLKDLAGQDGTIDLSSLKKIGGGGTHDVYRSDKHSNLLLKIMKHSIGKDDIELAKNLQKLDEQYSQLYKIFDQGQSRCIIEKRSIQSIKTRYSDQSYKKAIISVVPFDSCFEIKKDKFGFNVKSAELDGKLISSKRYLYDRVNRSLLSDYEKPDSYVMRNYPLLNKEFDQIFKLLDTDESKESLAKAMREFLTKYKAFYKQSDMLLDTIGFDNVLFYKSEGIWQFKVGSVIKHDTGALTKRTLKEINNNPAIVNESFEYFTSIYFMPACIRALNACAEKLGMGRIIEDIVINEKTINILSEMHNQLGEAHRIINYIEHREFSTALKLYNQYIATEKSYNTGLRDMMGTLYWEFIKNGGKESSKEEIEIYLKFLCDERNEFPDSRKKIVQEAIDGLNHSLEKKILSLESLSNHHSRLFKIQEPAKDDKQDNEEIRVDLRKTGG